MAFAKYHRNQRLTSSHLGAFVPKRSSPLGQKISHYLLTQAGWKIIGDLPNTPQAVLLAAPHTSNMDGVYAIAAALALGLQVSMMGKKELFKFPVLRSFLFWAGLLPIDRSKKGSVLEDAIARFKTGKPLWLALAPEGTRQYTKGWKTGFYYLAFKANVPIIPVAMDYGSKEIRFMQPFFPTGDIHADLPQIYAYYQGVLPKYPDKLSQPLAQIARS